MKKFIVRNQKEIVFVFIMFLIFLMISVVIPFKNAPDENYRLSIAQFIYKYKELPLGTDPEVRIPGYGGSYAFSPMLAYLFSSFWMSCMSFFSTNEQMLLFAARFANVIFSTITIIYIIKIAIKLFHSETKWIFIILCSTLPCFLFVSSYVNCDALAVTSIAIIIYAWIIGMNTFWNRSSVVNLIVGLSLCLLSYQNAYGYVFLSLVLFIYEIYRHKKTNKLSMILKKGAIIAVSVTILGGWTFLRNYQLYDGDFIGINANTNLAEKYATDKFRPSTKITMSDYASLKVMLVDNKWMSTSYKSFIGIFGYMNVPLNYRIYIFYNIIFSSGIICLILSYKKFFKINPDKRVFFVFLMAAIAIVIAMSIIYSYFFDFQPQGRYLLPALIPLMILISKGFENVLLTWLNKYKQKIVFLFYYIIMLSTLYILLNTFLGIYY